MLTKGKAVDKKFQFHLKQPLWMTIRFISKIHLRKRKAQSKKNIHQQGTSSFQKYAERVSPITSEWWKIQFTRWTRYQSLPRVFIYFPHNRAISVLSQPFFALFRHSDVKCDSRRRIKRLMTKYFFLQA